MHCPFNSDGERDSTACIEPDRVKCRSSKSTKTPQAPALDRRVVLQSSTLVSICAAQISEHEVEGTIHSHRIVQFRNSKGTVTSKAHVCSLLHLTFSAYRSVPSSTAVSESPISAAGRKFEEHDVPTLISYNNPNSILSVRKKKVCLLDRRQQHHHFRTVGQSPVRRLLSTPST